MAPPPGGQAHHVCSFGSRLAPPEKGVLACTRRVPELGACHAPEVRSIRSFRTLVPYFRRYRRAFLCGGLWIVLTSACAQMVPWLLGGAVDSLRSPERFHRLGPLFLALLGGSPVGGGFRLLYGGVLPGPPRRGAVG